MAYVDGDSLAVRIRIAFGAAIAADPATWVWTDVTDWWHTPDDVQIGWGRSSGAEQPETSTLSLTLKNIDGRFTAYDPRSPYWPNVRKWTPISFDIDLGDGWLNRFSGYIRKWPLTWPGASSLMALAKVEAVGVLGRLGRGKPPARSPLWRAIRASGAVAYWPAEDGVAASQAGSAIPGHPPLTVTGTTQFVAIQDSTFGKSPTLRYGTAALADLSGGGSIAATVPADVTAATATQWTVAVLAAADVLNASGDVVVAEVATPGGTYVRWQLVVRKATLRTQVIAYDSGGSATTVIDDPGVYSLNHYDFSAWQSGGNISVGYAWTGASHSITGSVAGTLGGVTAISANPTRATQTTEMPFGHLAVWAAQRIPLEESFTDLYGGFVFGAAYSWNQETATDRLARLCAEDGLALDIPPVSADTVQRMGWQPLDTSLNLYQSCEDADQGLLYESGFGLGYTPRASRYNAPVTLTVDAALGQLGLPFEPVDDDQMLRNRWTVERTDGSSATAEDRESIDLQGEIEGNASVNLATDGPLPDHAAWRLHLSTAQEPRYPALSLQLNTSPELAAAWCACKPGYRVQVVNPPQQNVPGVVDQLVVGATETYRGRTSWKATLNVVPASPWQVATVDGEQRAPADGSYLAAGVAMDDTTILVATPVEAPWTTDPIDLPVDIQLAGERMTATAITARVAPQFIAAGTATNGSNTGRTPALPAGLAAGDLLLIYATARSTPDHRAVAPDGYLTLFQDRNVALFGKIAEVGEVAPTVTFVGGVANSDTIAQMAAFRGAAPGVMASATQLNASAQNVAYPALTVPQPALILYLGWRQDDWTSVATLPGATEAGSRSSTLGDDAAQVWDYTIQTARANIPAGQFVVTGGLPAISRGAVVALWANVQTLTVVRGVNGVRKAHPTSSGAS